MKAHYVSANGNTFLVLPEAIDLTPEQRTKLFKAYNTNGIITHKEDGIPRFFEPCGWEIETCGNGILAYLSVVGYLKNYKYYKSMNGMCFVGFKKPQIKDMCRVREGIYYVDAGEPHVVKIFNGKLPSVKKYKHLTYEPNCFNRDINTTICTKLSHDKIEVQTFESGVYAQTLSCGTGSLAAYEVLNMYGLVYVQQLGGEARIYEKDNLLCYGLKPKVNIINNLEIK